MKIYFITPVRNASPELLEAVQAYVKDLEQSGDEVHFPPRDVDQNDPTGFVICQHHLAAMKLADKVVVYWDATSTGSHFDLGMAFALGKPVELVHLCQPDGPGKSYIKVMQQMTGGDYAPHPEKLAFQNKQGQINPNTSLSKRTPSAPKL